RLAPLHGQADAMPCDELLEGHWTEAQLLAYAVARKACADQNPGSGSQCAVMPLQLSPCATASPDDGARPVPQVAFGLRLAGGDIQLSDRSAARQEPVHEHRQLLPLLLPG